MKKIIFTIVGSMLISLGVIKAQQTDTTGAASDQNWRQQSEKNMQGYDQQALVIIDVQEVPSNIRQKLDEDDKYKGWEKATVYHNTTTGEYIIVPQPFAFDSEGNEKEMTDMGQSFGYHTPSNQSNDQSAQQNEDMSAEQQARRQMGEIPTSAPQDQDTTTYSDQADDNEQQSDRSARSYRSGDMEYNIADMTEVQTDEIPSSLRTTLEESEYEGWKENGTLYRNPSTSEFILVMDKTDDPSQAKTYRFDANGKRVDDL